MKCGLLEEIGKASYDIFLTQMVYYATLGGLVHRLVGSFAVQVIINIVICVAMGFVFNRIEAPITEYIKKESLSVLTKMKK